MQTGESDGFGMDAEFVDGMLQAFLGEVAVFIENGFQVGLFSSDGLTASEEFGGGRGGVGGRWMVFHIEGEASGPYEKGILCGGFDNESRKGGNEERQITLDQFKRLFEKQLVGGCAGQTGGSTLTA